MRVLVFGGRDFDDWALLCGSLDQVHSAYGITCVIQGEAKGADFLGRVWAKYRNIPFVQHLLIGTRTSALPAGFAINRCWTKGARITASDFPAVLERPTCFVGSQMQTYQHGV